MGGEGAGRPVHQPVVSSAVPLTLRFSQNMLIEQLLWTRLCLSLADNAGNKAQITAFGGRCFLVWRLTANIIRIKLLSMLEGNI